MILSVADYLWLAGILDRRAARYTKNAGKALAKGKPEAFVRRLEHEARQSSLTASRLRRGVELAGYRAPTILADDPHAQGGGAYHPGNVDFNDLIFSNPL